MASAKKTTKTPKTAAPQSHAMPRHRQASAKLQRFAKRMLRLIEKYGRYGAPVAEALAVAKGAFEQAVKHLDALPDDFQPAPRAAEAVKAEPAVPTAGAAPVATQPVTVAKAAPVAAKPASTKPAAAAPVVRKAGALKNGAK